MGHNPMVYTSLVLSVLNLLILVTQDVEGCPPVPTPPLRNRAGNFEEFGGMPTFGGRPTFGGLPTFGGMPPIRGMPPYRGMLPFRGMLPSRGMPPFRGITLFRGMPPFRGITPYRGLTPLTGMIPLRGLTPFREMSGHYPWQGNWNGSPLDNRGSDFDSKGCLPGHYFNRYTGDEGWCEDIGDKYCGHFPFDHGVMCQ